MGGCLRCLQCLLFQPIAQTLPELFVCLIYQPPIHRYSHKIIWGLLWSKLYSDKSSFYVFQSIKTKIKIPSDLSVHAFFLSYFLIAPRRTIWSNQNQITQQCSYITNIWHIYPQFCSLPWVDQSENLIVQRKRKKLIFLKARSDIMHKF